ncbi:MAG: hypothetical protein ACOCRK_07175 [bacterium]
MANYTHLRDKVDKSLKRDTLIFITTMFIFIFDRSIIFIYHNFDIAQLSKLKDLIDFFQWLAITFFGTIILYVINLFVSIDKKYFYKIEDFIFGTKADVDLFIINNLLNIQITNNILLNHKRVRLLEETDYHEDIMSCFYFFIEQPSIVNQTLKENSFTYWGDYFSKVISFTIYTFWIIIASVTLIFEHDYTYVKLAIFCFIVIVDLLYFRSIKNNKHLYDIPKQQIKEIHNNGYEQLVNNIRDI